MKIKAKKLHPDAIIPTHLLHGDAGLDLHSVEDVTIKPGERFAVSTGLAFEFPEGYVALIWDKSGLALKKGIKSMGGVIEFTYRGEYKIILFNTSNEDFIIKKGDKVAQMLIQPVMSVEVQEADELSETQRGSHGFGSADEELKKKK
jgi:dUTP pyrophosphatase